jgi:hypothetical protein
MTYFANTLALTPFLLDWTYRWYRPILVQRRGIFRPTTHHGTLSFGVGAVVHLIWSTYISHRRHVGAVMLSSDVEINYFLSMLTRTDQLIWYQLNIVYVKVKIYITSIDWGSLGLWFPSSMHYEHLFSFHLSQVLSAYVKILF